MDVLKLGYWGTQGYLDDRSKQAVMEWLRQRQTCQREELLAHVDLTYGVVFKSQQSYRVTTTCCIKLDHGRKRRHNVPRRTRCNSPKNTPKTQEIVELLMRWRSQIASGQVRVLLVDECHLLWGDACGYVWGKTNQRLEVPMASERQRQTYYGAFDYASKQFYLQAYDAGNTDNTIAFLNYLRLLDEQARLLIIGDGASYHRSQQLRAFLAAVNAGLRFEDWKIECIRFAPHAPEQNPVEDIWLQAKQFIRKFFLLCKFFAVVKYLFELVTHQQSFTF
ncbi:IS630 family transposase [Chroogloeocystis siderophila]|uniref:IS630 family transposase n=1 Tax=Chroogloeocystis siderophila TaxID=329163 RepID=UPI001F008B56|nr:IS630 family transposase [Chroogloeocystis siderophila]